MFNFQDQVPLGARAHIFKNQRQQSPIILDRICHIQTDMHAVQLVNVKTSFDSYIHEQ